MNVLITGAARGLGRAILDKYLSQGATVWAVNVDCAPLMDIANVVPIAVDLTCAEMAGVILNHIGVPVDVVIHAAGISAVGAFETLPWQQQKSVWDVNFSAPIRLTQALLSGDYLSSEAKICFVASLSCYVGYPGAATYAGTKDGLCSYARSLAKSAIAKDMSITVAYPGPLRTEHAARYAPDNSEAAVQRRMRPDLAANLIVSDMNKGRLVSLPGLSAKVAALLGRIAPSLMIRLMRKAIFKKLPQTEE